MARKEFVWTASTGRDKGKKFLITEMSARAGHEWATRLLLAFLATGLEIPEDVADRGLAGLASMAGDLFASIGKVPPAVALPLMDQLLLCVQSVQEKGVRKLFDDDLEEISTIFQLQMVVFNLHVEPFTSGGLSTSESPQEAATAG